MKTWLLSVLALCCGLQATQCCSCIEGAFTRSRITAIRDDYNSKYNSQVYSARVVGANCNCRMGNTTLKCVSYTGDESTRTAQVTTVGECETGSFSTFYYNMCPELSTALNVSSVDIMQPDGLPTVDLTAMAVNGRCPNICPFNTMDNDDPFNSEIMSNPCRYTLQVLEVFKPVNASLGTTVMSFGPDVLTSCGNPSRRLSIGETYLVGVGGGCNPIPGWSTLESYADSEVDLLRELRRGGALGLLPSLLSLTLAVLAMFMLLY